MKKVAIIMGSDSDLPVMRKAADTLRDFGVPFEVHIMSAHRTPDAAAAFARSARERALVPSLRQRGWRRILPASLLPTPRCP